MTSTITLLPPYSAALIKTKKTKTLVIADLHIGWEIALSERGIHVPTQTYKLLQRLKDLLTTHEPETLLIIGDVKHTVATAQIVEWQDVPAFFTELTPLVKQICIIRGNHDGNLAPLLPEKTKVLPSTGIIMDDVGLFHGHRWPSPSLLKCKTLVMAHIHPVVILRDPAGFRITRQIWVKATVNRNVLARILLEKNKVKLGKSVGETLEKCYKTKPKTAQLFIMPSFNDFLGGKPLNEARHGEKTVGPILRTEAVDLENAEAYLLDGTFLGTLKQLELLT
jgi:putative SbcD/Mre11-related phosphoesterase